mmetsp:Transcript_42340/g.122941  ORF Transcript_42340/g.122941 Transcript_42340/m.122941 type:complete len:474 (+) Transcript_42340:212-1633(+)
MNRSVVAKRAELRRAASTPSAPIPTAGDHSSPVAKLTWVQVFEQWDLDTPKRIPVPRDIQRGHEDSGKLTLTDVCKWLSRGLEQRVSAVHTCQALPSSANSAWQMTEFHDDIRQSPFLDGTLVVCCCDGDLLRQDLCERFAAKVKAGVYKAFDIPIEADPSASGEGLARVFDRARSLGALRFITNSEEPPEETKQPEPAAQPERGVSPALLRKLSKRGIASTSASNLPSLPETSRLQGVTDNPTDAAGLDAELSGLKTSKGRATEFEEYVVDNSTLDSSSLGLRPFASKNPEDRFQGKLLHWGQIVRGTDEGDGWVKLANGFYLPAAVGGVRVLTLRDEFVMTMARGKPRFERFALADSSAQTDAVEAPIAEAAPAPQPQPQPPPRPQAYDASTMTEPGWAPPGESSAAVAPPTPRRGLMQSRYEGLAQALQQPLPRPMWSMFASCADTSGCAAALNGRLADDEGAPPVGKVL